MPLGTTSTFRGFSGLGDLCRIEVAVEPLREVLDDDSEWEEA